ncbi:DUF6910 family protein [Virgisporangium ochraceum]|uniref:Uncharacterized protein n=1 Tax=Virgisporangium ochraceum TaxID=65505 RepID=A0A8J4A9L0_9ACTN|nr:hypothetical protein [Virgisporangium ochraceum]GIJ75516.1 hypothetical protein Voc01_104330 [Virgisporangium ochraceum]
MDRAGLTVRIEVEHETALRFDDGSPVRSASAIAPFGDGWLIAQDDATHAAWHRPTGTTPVRVLDAVDGLEVFGVAAGTKHLKPDFEAACEAPAGVLLLGSGSTPRRMRASTVALNAMGPAFAVTDLTPLYGAVAHALGLPAEHLNLEGACVAGGRVRWFQRGNAAAGIASASVDVDLLTAAPGRATVDPHSVRRYDLGAIDGADLAITDAVTLPDGRILVSAAAEDTPNPFDDGPVVASALAVLDGDRVDAVTPLPERAGPTLKVEGLALCGAGPRVLAVVDRDDPSTPSTMLRLRLHL